MASAPKADLGAVIGACGPNGQARVSAALRVLGLRRIDLDISAKDTEVSELVPSSNAGAIKEKKREVWNGMQAARLAEIERVAKSLKDEEVELLQRLGEGLHGMGSGDLAPASQLESMADFKRAQEAALARANADAKRKLDRLVCGFRTEKRRQDQADEADRAFERRQKDFKKKQSDALAKHRKELADAAQKRAEGAQRAAIERAEWEDAEEAKMWERMRSANERRTKHYSSETLREKAEKARLRREAATSLFLESQQETMERFERRQLEAEERLNHYRDEKDEEYLKRAEQRSIKFAEKHQTVVDHFTEMAKKSLSEHADFKKRCETAQKEGKMKLKQRSRSCGDVRQKAADKARSTLASLQESRNHSCAELLERQQKAWEHVEAQRRMGEKCNNDVHSFREVKYALWSELHARNNKALQHSRDTAASSLLRKTADFRAKEDAQEEAVRQRRKRQQLILKDSLLVADNARVGFIKIQAESDEGKIAKVLSSLGFEMPAPPEDDGPE